MGVVQPVGRGEEVGMTHSDRLEEVVELEGVGLEAGCFHNILRGTGSGTKLN